MSETDATNVRIGVCRRRRPHVRVAPPGLVQGGFNTCRDEVFYSRRDTRSGQSAAQFVDDYYEVPFDLSQVTFCLTANTLNSVPSYVADRCMVVSLQNYTIKSRNCHSSLQFQMILLQISLRQLARSGRQKDHLAPRRTTASCNRRGHCRRDNDHHKT